MNIFKRTLTLGLGLALILAIGASGINAGDQDFVLVNKTGYDINNVYIAHAKDKTWGDDVMEDDVLEDGTKVNIHFPNKTTQCVWDMKIIFTDEEEAVWEGFDLCKISEITLKYEGKRPTAFTK